MLTIVQLRIDYTEGINTIEQRLDQIRLTNLNTITQSLWTLDTDSIEVQLQGLRRIPDIIRIELRNNKNELITSLGSVNTTHTITRQFPINIDYRQQELLLGELKVVATKENLYQKLIDTVLVILISQAVKTFLVSIFILIIFYYLVTRHIIHIANHQATANITEKPEPLTLPYKVKTNHSGDELNRLVSSFNRMAEDNYRNYQTVVTQKNALANNEALFLAIFNAISDSIVVADTNRKILMVNTAFHNQFGYSDDELIGRTTQLLYTSSNEYEEQGKLRYSKDSNSPEVLYEISYVRRDGSSFVSETMGAPINLPDGEHIGFVAIIRDITQRKNAEQENKRLLRELQQSQKMESIGHLTGGIAHDFNNILASILGYTDLAINMVEKTHNDKLEKYLTHIKTSSERASNLVAQMLAFSRNTPSEPEALELPNVINETINILKPTLPSSIRVNTLIKAEIPMIMMDRTQLQQVIINICVNARDAMHAEGNLVIEVDFRRALSLKCASCHATVEGDFVDLSISDTGTGIDSSLINHIFDPFFTTKDVGKGSGMGLSVAHGILHQHHAHIYIDTQTNVGTSFHLLFPVAVSDSTEAPKKKQNSKPVDPAFGAGKRILIVDDEELILHYLKNLLEMYGFTITITTSSLDALETLKKDGKAFDLLITDQTMPALTGLGLIRELQKMNADIPVILCSGYSEKVNEDNANELGIDAFIAKPLSQTELLSSLQQLL